MLVPCGVGSTALITGDIAAVEDGADGKEGREAERGSLESTRGPKGPESVDASSANAASIASTASVVVVSTSSTLSSSPGKGSACGDASVEAKSAGASIGVALKVCTPDTGAVSGEKTLLSTGSSCCIGGVCSVKRGLAV